MNTICKYMERKSLIYKTEVEYGDYTINHVQGCSHGCLYPCYAYMMAKRFGKVRSYEEWLKPSLVSNALELLDREIPKYKNKISSVHLCFTTDPFMYNHREITRMSMEIIKKLNDNHIKCTALTKGILPIELTELSKQNEYGISLVSLNEDFRSRYEPYASPYLERIKSLKSLHDNGCKTWVSIEPYPTPNIIDQNIYDVLNSISFVDKIVFGRLNYNCLVSEYKDNVRYYNELSRKVTEFCFEKGIELHIKKGTVLQNNELVS